MKRLSIVVCLLYVALGVQAQGERAEEPLTVYDCLVQAMTMDRGVVALIERSGSPLGEREPSFRLMADDKKVNKAQSEAAKRLGAEMERCKKIEDHSLNGLPTRYIEADKRHLLVSSMNLAALAVGKLTFGGYAVAQAESARIVRIALEESMEERAQQYRQAQYQRQLAEQAAFERTMRAEAMARAEAARVEAEERVARAEREQARRESEILEAQRKLDNHRQFMGGLMMMEMARPRPAPISPSINCTSRNSFGTVITNCN